MKMKMKMKMKADIRKEEQSKQERGRGDRKPIEFKDVEEFEFGILQGIVDVSFRMLVGCRASKTKTKTKGGRKKTNV